MQSEYNEDASFYLFIIFIINDVLGDRPSRAARELCVCSSLSSFRVLSLLVILFSHDEVLF